MIRSDDSLFGASLQRNVVDNSLLVAIFLYDVVYPGSMCLAELKISYSICSGC